MKRTCLFCILATLALGCTSREPLRLYVLDCGRIPFLDLEETGPIVLSGDLYFFPVSREL